METRSRKVESKVTQDAFETNNRSAMSMNGAAHKHHSCLSPTMTSSSQQLPRTRSNLQSGQTHQSLEEYCGFLGLVLGVKYLAPPLLSIGLDTSTTPPTKLNSACNGAFRPSRCDCNHCCCHCHCQPLNDHCPLPLSNYIITIPTYRCLSLSLALAVEASRCQSHFGLRVLNYLMLIVPVARESENYD